MTFEAIVTAAVARAHGPIEPYGFGKLTKGGTWIFRSDAGRDLLAVNLAGQVVQLSPVCSPSLIRAVRKAVE